MTMLDNIYVIAVCAGKNQTCCGNHSTDLNKFGGTCYISDAMEIRSEMRRINVSKVSL